MEHQEVAMIGKIAAGMTHEVKNILATIHEAAGLIQDLLGAGTDGAIPRRDTLTSALNKIQKQVERGTEVATMFNRFAHAMNHETAWVEAKEVAELVTFLMERAARQKQIPFSRGDGGRSFSALTHPIRLLLTLSKCAEFCLERGVKGQRLMLRTAGSEERPAFELELTAADGADGDDSKLEDLDPEGLEDWSGVLRELDIEIRRLDAQGVAGMLLMLPRS